MNCRNFFYIFFLNITVGQHMVVFTVWFGILPWLLSMEMWAPVKAWVHLSGGQLLHLEEFNTIYCSLVSMH